MPIFAIKMYRIALISILCFLAVVPAFRLSIIYGCYELNKEHITNTYCVNIDEPVLMCSGKCYVNDIIDLTITPEFLLVSLNRSRQQADVL